MSAKLAVSIGDSQEVEKHVLEGDVQQLLQNDEDFQKQTVKELPAGIHPDFTGEEAALWQKPASKVDQLDSAAGFVQVWVPTDIADLGLLSITSGEYNRDDVLAEIQQRLSEAV